jgi:hypothetical protein
MNFEFSILNFEFPSTHPGDREVGRELRIENSEFRIAA